jgi:hypothetical protein
MFVSGDLTAPAQGPIMNAISTAALALSGAVNRIDAVAMRLAGAPDGGDATAAAVELAQARSAVQANAAIIRSADKMNSALLDIKV